MKTQTARYYRVFFFGGGTGQPGEEKHEKRLDIAEYTEGAREGPGEEKHEKCDWALQNML